jgi:hypothetical protein
MQRARWSTTTPGPAHRRPRARRTPGIIIPDAKKPTKQVVQTLIHGDGPKVKKTDGVRVQFTSVDWDTRKVVNSTWDSQSAVISGAAGSRGRPSDPRCS